MRGEELETAVEVMVKGTAKRRECGKELRGEDSLVVREGEV